MNSSIIKPKEPGRLGNKFYKNFIFLTSLGLFGTLFLTVFLLTVFFSKIKVHQSTVKSFNDVHQLEQFPLINQIQQIILSTFQPLFSDLIILDKYAKYIADFKSLIEKCDPKTNSKYCDYIEQYSINARKVPNECPYNDTHFIDKGIWFINPSIEKLSDINDSFILNELHLTVLLNPLFNSIFNVSNIQTTFIERMLVIFPESDLFYQYPSFYDKTLQDKYNNSRGWCSKKKKVNDPLQKDNNDYIEYPQYNYYKCEQWYMDAQSLFDKTHKNLSLSYPYRLKSGNIGASLCKKAFIDIKDKDQNKNRTDVIYCIEVNLIEFRLQMETLNNGLSGFFFLSRIKTKILLYYPNDHFTLYEDYSINEFGDNTPFFLDELNLFNNSTQNILFEFSKELCELNNSTESTDNSILNCTLNGTYIKDDIIWRYTIYPLEFHDSECSSNLINLIHVEKDNCMSEVLNNLLTLNAEIFFTPIIYFIIQGVLLNLLSQFLVYSIAANIVLPMKNIKKILEKLERMDNEDNVQDIEQRKSTKSKEKTAEEIENDDMNNEINRNDDEPLQPPNAENEPLKDDENDNDNDSQSNDGNSDEEEEYINIRSRDIQDLFCRIIDVRNSLSTVNTESTKVTTKLLPDMLFASEKLREIKNNSAFEICNSNVGKLLIDCKKYDIAIMHLIQSDALLFNDKDPTNNIVLNKRGSKKISNAKGNKNDQSNFGLLNESSNFHSLGPLSERMNVNGNVIGKNAKAESEQNKLQIESRYPKLIFAFREFFKNLNRLDKLRSRYYANKNLSKEIITEIELYSTEKMHMLYKYRDAIDNYYFLTRNRTLNSNSKLRFILALFEKIKFYLKFEIKESRATNEKFQEVVKMFEEAKEAIKKNKDSTKPKNILKILIKENAQINSLDVPNEILIQRLNYYRGLLAYKSTHYVEALGYFIKVTSPLCGDLIISDAKIVYKATVKINKIAELFYSQLIKKETEMKLLEQYIQTKKDEIAKFKFINKDYVILINCFDGEELIKSGLEKARYVIENFVTYEDRFCLSLVGEGEMKIIAKMQKKDKENEEYLYDYIQNLRRDEDFIRNSAVKEKKEKDEDIKFVIKKAKGYLIKKNVLGEKRIVFYVFMTNDLSEKSIEFLCSEEEEIMKLLNKQENIILMMHKIPNDEIKDKIERLSQIGIVKFNEMLQMKKKITMNGDVFHNAQFSLETYLTN